VLFFDWFKTKDLKQNMLTVFPDEKDENILAPLIVITLGSS